MSSILLKTYVGASSVRICAATMAIALVGTLSSAAADPITIQGSTTFNRRLMEPHQEEIETISGQQLTVIPNKSTPGLIALLEGRAQLAMISAPLEAEIELLQEVMPGLSFDHLHAFEIARTRVSFAVNRMNPVRAATIEQIADIMLGKIDNWSALQGPDLPIRVVLVGGGGGLTAAVEIRHSQRSAGRCSQHALCAHTGAADPDRQPGSWSDRLRAARVGGKDEYAGAQDRQALRAGPLPGYVRRTNAGGAVCH